MRALSIANIEDKKYDYIPFEGEFSEAFGHRERGGIWIIYGKSGMGKTRFTLDLAREFDRIGFNVLFATLEMGICSDFHNELQAAGIRSRLQRIKFVDELSIADLDNYLSKQRSPDVIFIDSIQYFTDQFEAKAEEIVQLRKKYRSKIFIFISHVEGKEVEGKAAYIVKRDSFVRIQVEGFRAIYKGRGRGGPKGYYTIWDEGADKYWLENNKEQ